MVEQKKRIKKVIHYSDNFSDYRSLRYWPTWLGLGAMKVLAHFPYRLVLLLGKLLGNLMLLFAHDRRRIATTNIRLCFPELTTTKQKQLTRQTMIDSGVGLLEMCIAWFNPNSITDDMVEFVGEQHLTDAVAKGQGVILVGAHYTTLDLGGVLMAKYQQVGVMYRRLKNPLFNLVMKNSRKKFCAEVIERSDMRSVIRFIRKGGIMWYAPDQDYGPKQAVFAPFFGIEAATITVIPRLVKINNSAVIILGHHRKPNGEGYIVTLSEPLINFPSGDEKQDATVINAALEERIRQYPAQYMWLHRRFKSRQEGQEKLYS